MMAQLKYLKGGSKGWSIGGSKRWSSGGSKRWSREGSTGLQLGRCGYWWGPEEARNEVQVSS